MFKIFPFSKYKIIDKLTGETVISNHNTVEKDYHIKWKNKLTKEIIETFEYCKKINEYLNKYNNKNDSWKDSLLYNFILSKYDGEYYNINLTKGLMNLTSFELIMLMNEYEKEI